MPVVLSERCRALGGRGFLVPAGAILSGVLLAVSFPPWEVYRLAWLALVPLLLVLRFARRGEAFRLGFAAGTVFWLLTLAWLLRLADTAPVPAVLIWLAWIALSLYCALFVGGFGFVVAWLYDICERMNRVLRNVLLIVVVPLTWVGFEYLRSMMFTGFAWNPLGVSQYPFSSIAQIAQWGGVFGVSALIVMMNAAIAFTILRYLRDDGALRYRPHYEIFLAVAIFGVCLRIGWSLEAQYAGPPTGITVAAIQPNIAQPNKWSVGFAQKSYRKLRELTESAITLSEITRDRKPGLIIWPETAVPDFARLSEDCAAFIGGVLTNGVPLLVGTLDADEGSPEDVLYNSSFLYVPPQKILQRYGKQRLVPFGEYIPLGGVFPFLRRFEPQGWSCAPGREATVFRLGETAFSVLICFEDTIAPLAGDFVRRGARLLVNQTNDAWFDKSAASVQHMSHFVFRCIENRVPGIRVTNTGMTCLVDRRGRIYHGNSAGDGAERAWGPLEPFEEGVVVGETVPAPDRLELTLYTRRGDWVFAIPAAGLTLVCLAWGLAGWRRERPCRDATAPAGAKGSLESRQGRA